MTGAFVFCPEAMEDDIINLVGIFWFLYFESVVWDHSSPSFHGWFLRNLIRLCRVLDVMRPTRDSDWTPTFRRV
jgi:hypothetical protein